MAIEKTGGVVRKALTRVLAAGALLAIYAVATVTTSGVFLASATTAANAYYRGRGRGYYRGGYRGYRGGYRGGWGRGYGHWCHRPWNSRRYYCY